jgi:hypothetical protein
VDIKTYSANIVDIQTYSVNIVDIKTYSVNSVDIKTYSVNIVDIKTYTVSTLWIFFLSIKGINVRNVNKIPVLIVWSIHIGFENGPVANMAVTTIEAVEEGASAAILSSITFNIRPQ